MIRTGTFQYVLHGDIERFHKMGWMIVADPIRIAAWALVGAHVRCDCHGVGVNPPKE